jgi:hypothetical protein
MQGSTMPPGDDPDPSNKSGDELPESNTLRDTGASSEEANE